MDRSSLAAAQPGPRSRSLRVVGVMLCACLAPLLACTKEHDYDVEPPPADAEVEAPETADAASGASAEAEADAQAPDTLDDEDAAVVEPDARGDTPEDAQADEPDASDARALMNAFLAEYQRSMVMQCPCFVANGGFPSEEACRTELFGQRLTVSTCLDDAIPQSLREDTLAWMRCLVRSERTKNECLEKATCSHQDECVDQLAECAQPDPRVLQGVSDTCPQVLVPL